MTDIIADMITRIRNGQQRKLVSIEMPCSKFRKSILDVIQKEGYISSYKEMEVRKGISKLSVSLKYLNNGRPVIQEIKKVSKPGKRIYTTGADLKGCYNDLGVVILSTSKGIMSDHDAKQSKVGGEIICKVF